MDAKNTNQLPAPIEQADNQQVEPAKNIPVIGERAIGEYPETELEQLRGLMDKRGFISACYRNTGVTDPTLRRWLREGSGEVLKVNSVRRFVTEYTEALKQTA